MKLTEQELLTRSHSICELCGSKEELAPVTVEPREDNLIACVKCRNEIANPDSMDVNHWRCLNDSMWSEHLAVKIMAWRLLNRIKHEGWPNDLLDMLYMEEEDLEWAKTLGDGVETDDNQIVHKDANGAVLESGDSVVLIKDLNVKGANFTAKRGTAVRNISLVYDNPEQIEGKVEGQHIVILTQYVKK